MKKTLTLVTGNENKRREFEMLLYNFQVEMKALDLEEVQSLDTEYIAKEKAKKAYSLLQKPVIVEDVSAHLDALEGLPGPFIKYFEKKLGDTALLRLLGEEKNRAAFIRCTCVYFDGESLLVSVAEMKGHISREKRGEDGWGFDVCFIPEGQEKTLAEMGREEKINIFPRSLALHHLSDRLKKEGKN
ncbi:non-canonical purine NTP pyrophosphatase [Candidatus Woesearchaeota archaeon]|nr:non-canonical purine NTP pyrophosphatase [Nanoarchaeota archaeon]MCB9370739.1 non-canonical purine NTP pyrophosphatase [Candidatus Woesearchaeota archaeon]